jgi:hypothetical protein
MKNNIVVVRLMGGLGNQMFQFAFYLALKSSGKKTFVDLSFYDSNDSHNGYELKRIFKLDPDYVDYSTSKKIVNLENNLYQKIRRKILPIKSHLREKYFDFERIYSIINQKIIKHNLYLDGYWEDERYFKGILPEIRKAFAFRALLSDKNFELLKIIKSSISISVHVRRGDKVNSKLHLILDEEYYNKAIKIMESKFSNPIFFIFSDDLSWVSNFVSNLNIHYIIVDWNRYENSYLDMQLMSQCDHNVIANSTFSWWGAYLNSNPGKVVIAPEFRFNVRFRRLENKHFIPDEWIKI